MTGPPSYVGRFAPSPTGPLHFGSLLAAVASYLEARTRRGQWLLRLEDIDPPREQPGAIEEIVAAMEAFGFEWDGPVHYQSETLERHQEAIASLIERGFAYPCECSRRDLADAPRGPLGIIYPGTCRDGCDSDDVAIRLRTDDVPVVFTDRLQGQQSQRLESESGDFVILRRDKLIAYHLAVVVDDHEHGVNEIVRGIDLIDSTPRQIYLQRLLGYTSPSYAHIPVAVHPDGDKLSKLTGAPGLSVDHVVPLLVRALDVLRQDPPRSLLKATLADIWAWAFDHWDIDALRGLTRITVDINTLAGVENPLS